MESYAESHGLDLNDLSWLLQTTDSGHKGAVTIIAAAACPDRTRKAMWQVMQRMYDPEARKVGSHTLLLVRCIACG